ncbi:hypothetical protein GCM10023330_05710 [Litoribaculum gwangyangense]|uniref:Transposase n=1 Tax=Litoribaculum gwangyangense TaxID=1130722 RepID=A0ABP9C3M8_9FLAO
MRVGKTERNHSVIDNSLNNAFQMQKSELKKEINKLFLKTGHFV